MTGRFYIVILFTKRFHGSADFTFQTRLQACLQNKEIVRHLFSSILILYTTEASTEDMTLTYNDEILNNISDDKILGVQVDDHLLFQIILIKLQGR